MHRARLVDAAAVLPIVAVTAVAALAWPALPDQLVVQWGVDGAPSNTMAKPLAIVGNLALGVGAIAAIRLGVRQRPMVPRVEHATVLFVGGVLAAVQTMIVAWNLGYRFNAALPALVIVALGGALAWYAVRRS